ncbi:MAG: hypothetical protein AAFQ51_15215, partial [Pseudomonadota bacterium]
MPATLGHIGVQALITRGVIRGADFKWILLGCVLPDVPWILQRLTRAGLPSVDVFDLRIYAIVQSSLVFTLILCGACALVARHPLRVFGILAVGALLHLLLDASQTKWANGVILFAPLDWRLVAFGFYWPEDVITLILLLFGLAYAAFAWWAF